MANSMDVKGSVIASIPAFIEKKFGREGLSKWMDHVSADARLIFSKKIKEDNWYPLTIALTEPMANIAHFSTIGISRKLHGNWGDSVRISASPT